MDQLAALRAFTRIVETGSFSRASETLGVPRATVTKLVQSLEAHLRTALLNRSTRRVAVTSDGAAYYERAIRLLADLDELDGSLATSQTRPSGRLRIDVPPSFAHDIIIPALGDFFDRYPDIQLDIGASDRPVDLVAENVDCVVRGGTISDTNLIARKIASLELSVCAAPAYLARHGAPAHPDDLAGHRRLAFASAVSGRVYPFELERDGERASAAGPWQMTVNEVESLVIAAVAGLGIAQLPAFLARRYLEDGRLARVLPEWRSEPVPIYIVYPPNRHLSRKLRVFVDWAVTLFASALPAPISPARSG